MKEYDAVVIGGGPAGMTAALYLLRAGVKTAMLEKLSPGGQVLMTSEIENYPGFPTGLQGWELADKFAAHLESYPLERINDEVRGIELGEPYHTVVVGEERVRAKAIILATGSRYRKLGVPGEERLLGKGVSYCALCDGNFFRDRDVAVIGGGNSALEEALYLARLVNKIYLIHRREDFRGLVCYQEKCFRHEKIEVMRSTVIEEIVGDAGVESLALRNMITGEKSLLKVDGAFIFVGFEPIMDFVPDAVNKDRNGVITDVEMRTNIPGVFAAGDIRSKMCRQVASAVGDGATAATAAFSYLEQIGL
ncbi:MAG: thioredoxin-disulfide reductase [Pseudodesulfovibrio sp.]|uniref:Thioredoxin reductase n=1 Tax=Pseudodesulfovibrio aespoeensis (strain ATCC 700646 / DSM 10631 / Aspo-2) TaxID=643562 RepID=E6VZ59_PSEA9|nr:MULTISPECIES: thioredoxin-disulfide reductase [Pseudodesulfovibrio]MBU4245267.1 thioredoxin-disulfide reductase [Pseudomonadota bacterium]ADU62835.1 thioredoxin reductase [Pseudodesulfovibrio aespoeensis Aspo-2]MBU4380154.1 thioredoxin-disulfide reductase [Pseudomonadota bacterium]MBU4474594.1 thioredoxin-disulfide reductase [Pseudomonadota bacterium]MBU4514933.1 thioredoxin-disulfide reductase [Pseudomonadota bacterium]